MPELSQVVAAAAAGAVLGGLVVSASRKRTTGGVRHCVMGKFTADATDEQKRAMVEAVLTMKKDIPEIVGITCGIDLQLADGNFGFAATVDFASEEDYKIYSKHPAHVAVIAKNIRPILQPGTRSAAQYALP